MAASRPWACRSTAPRPPLSTTKYALEGSVNPLSILTGNSAGIMPKLEETTASLECDMKGEVQVGAGVTGNMGGGVKMKVEVDPRDLVKAITSDTVGAMRHGDTGPMLNKLGQTPVKVSWTVYGTASINGELAVSELGTGGKVSGGRPTTTAPAS
jgi:hypothetical protein